MARGLSFLLGLAIIGLSVQMAPSANAGGADVGGLQLIWDDADWTAPRTDDCRTIKLKWTNLSSVAFRGVPARLRQPGATDGNLFFMSDSVDSGFGPGTSGRAAASLCSFSGWRAGIPTTLEVAGGVIPLPPLNAPLKQVPIVAQNVPCTPEETANFAAYCESGTVLRLDAGLVWGLSLDSETVFTLANERRAIPVTEVEAPDPLDRLVGTIDVFLRPKGRLFTAGRYLILGSSYAAGRWSCSLSYQDVCRWYGGGANGTAYTFKWSGQSVTATKKLSYKQLRRLLDSVYGWLA